MSERRQGSICSRRNEPVVCQQLLRTDANNLPFNYGLSKRVRVTIHRLNSNLVYQGSDRFR